MPIRQFVWIDGQNVSPWVMNIDCDVVIPAFSQENYCQQADVILSNVNGKFDGAFGGMTFGPQSTMVIILNSIEYTNDLDNPYSYAATVYTGRCQNVEFGFRTVKIHAGTDDSQSNAYLKFDGHAHKGSNGEDVLMEVIGMDGLQIAEITLPSADNIKKREWGFLRDQSRKGVIDYMAEWHGCEAFMNESDQLVYAPPAIQGENPTYRGRMKEPLADESAISFCNVVKVVGSSFLDATDPGAENPASDTPQYETTLADLQEMLNNENGEGGAEVAASMIETYGWIHAPTFYVPELTTKEECRKRARRLLARYITYYKRALPAVVGRTPRLRSKITYEYKRLVGAAEWLSSGVFSGRVVRAKTNFSPKTGWVCYIEVEPYVLNSAMQEEVYGNLEKSVSVGDV